MKLRWSKICLRSILGLQLVDKVFSKVNDPFHCAQDQCIDLIICFHLCVVVLHRKDAVWLKAQVHTDFVHLIWKKFTIKKCCSQSYLFEFESVFNFKNNILPTHEIETYRFLYVLALTHVLYIGADLWTSFINFGENNHFRNPCQYKVEYNRFMFDRLFDSIYEPHNINLTQSASCKSDLPHLVLRFIT